MKIHGHALLHATQASIIIITVLTVWAEFSKPLKDFLAAVTGHHWVTKGFFSLLVFIILYIVLSRFSEHIEVQEARSEIMRTITITIVCGLALLLFFTWHFFAA
jgi:hypothetical protein